MPNLYHRYSIEGSLDGKNWFEVVNKKNSFKDTPNDYVVLENSVELRYIRYLNQKVPTTHLAISGFRVFGKGNGKVTPIVKNFKVARQDDQRDAKLTWDKQLNAQGYNIKWGIAPDKLYSSWLVYDANELLMKSLTKGQSYYFSVEAFNENGISTITKPLKVE